jgi:hypothetical protein
MTPQNLIKDLLIPYNSSKFLDVDKIGEHGIGWYSIMDLAEKVEVITSKDGKFSHAVVYKSGDNWFTDIDVKDGEQKGTIVVAHVNKTKTNDKLIKDNLIKHLGLVPSKEIEITYNGQKINTLDNEYPYSAKIVLNFKGRKDSLKIGYKKRDGNKLKTIKVTQDGLFIADMENPFTKKTLHHDLLNMCLESNLEIWIDLPKNIGLTKGRKEIVKKDQAVYYSALVRVFETLLLGRILDDEELVSKMDNELQYIMKNIFFDSYDLSSSIYFRNNQPFDIDSFEDIKPENYADPFEGFNFTTIANENEYMKRAKRYFNEITHITYEIFSKQFIRVQKLVKDVLSSLKLSANDLILLDKRGLLGETSVNVRPENDGIYFDPESKLIYAVYNQIKIVKMTEKEKSVKLDTKKTDDSIDEIARIPVSEFNEKIKAANIGIEYLVFFEAIVYLDNLFEEAMNKAKTQAFFLVNAKEDKISPDEHGFAFNFYHESLKKIVKNIFDKNFDKNLFYTILDLYLYAKTYIVLGKFYISLEEVDEFYEETKKKIRDGFVNYIFENRIDIEKELKNILTKCNSKTQTTVQELVKKIKQN